MISIMHDELHLCKAVAFELANRSSLIALAWLVASVQQLFNTQLWPPGRMILMPTGR